MDEQEKRGPRGEERFFYKFSGWSVTYRRYPPRLQSTLGLGCPALQGLTRVAVVSATSVLQCILLVCLVQGVPVASPLNSTIDAPGPGCWVPGNGTELAKVKCQVAP